MDPFYGGVIWTKHALARARERSLTQEEILRTIKNSSTSADGSTKKSTKYTKITENKLIEVVVKRNEKNQIVVLSCWSGDKKRFKIKIPLWESVLRWLGRQIFK